LAKQLILLKFTELVFFANLFLDSAFTGTIYKYKDQMPKNLLPGLDFVNGALMAADSLITNQQVQLYFYDLRSSQQSISSLKSQNIFDSLDLMIGAVAGSEYKIMADIAQQKHIPFISGTYPNDGGVTNNPYTVLINSTLPMHCEAIFNYIMRSNPTANILYVRKPGQTEDRLASYFNKQNKTTSGNQLLKWKTVSFTDSMTADDLLTYLDSSKTNLILCASIDEKFGLNLATVANNLIADYDIQLMGMPTWDAMKDLSKPEFKELSVYYSTAFYNTGSPRINNFTKQFNELSNGRPSDLAYRGYELTYYFINLLLKYNKNLMQNLNDKSFRTFTDFEFKPIINTSTGKTDYFENKKIYILKKSKGMISRMN
jgi:ABC-type branched-subunit amino acid transport system substrate-binding protein